MRSRLAYQIVHYVTYYVCVFTIYTPQLRRCHLKIQFFSPFRKQKTVFMLNSDKTEIVLRSSILISECDLHAFEIGLLQFCSE